MSLKKLNNDYLTQKDKIIIFIKLYVIFFLIGYLFYENIFLAILFGFASILIYQNQIKEKNKKIKDEIIEKFNEFINIFDSYIMHSSVHIKSIKIYVQTIILLAH